MLKTLKSKRKRTSKIPTFVEAAALDQTTSQNDLFSKSPAPVHVFADNKENSFMDDDDDSFLAKIDWEDFEDPPKWSANFGKTSQPSSPQCLQSSPGFSDRDRKLKYKSPVMKTPSKSQREGHQQTTPKSQHELHPQTTPSRVMDYSPRFIRSSQNTRSSDTPTKTSPLKNEIPIRNTFISPPSSKIKLTSPNQSKSVKKHTKLQDIPMTTPVCNESPRDDPKLKQPCYVSSTCKKHPLSDPEIKNKVNENSFSKFENSADNSFNSSVFFQTPNRVSNTQRILYGTGLLSPYTSKSNETVRLGVPEEVFRLLSKIRGITTLYPWQEETVSNCLSGGNHIITCPTSGGKTLVGELLLLNSVLTRDCDALLILPYVALVEEKVKELAEFAEHFSFGLERYAGSRGRLPPRKRRKKKTIYVATIEKANALFNSLYEAGRCSELGVVIVDELHMIGDGYRGAILETCLAKLLTLQPGPRIIGMTATLNNHGEVAHFLRCSMEHIGGTRPVTITEHVKIDDIVYKVDKEKGLERLYPMKYLQNPRNTSKLVDTDGVATLVQEKYDKGECVLVFCPTKKSCETTARMLSHVLSSSASEEIKTKRETCIQRIKSETGNLDRILAETLPMGISYHHSGLTGDEKSLIEEAFCSSVITVLCCTTTLAAGINLPASRVVMRSLKTGPANLTRTRYLQMVGRAGRTGLTNSGDSYILGRGSDKKLLHGLVFGEIENVRSCLDQHSLTLTLLHLVGSGMIQSFGDLGTYMKRTLLHVQNPDTCLTVAEAALKVLQDSKFIEKKDGKIFTTPFGRAVYKSALDPSIAHNVIHTLRQANRHIVLQGDLHLVYLCVPPADILDNVYIDWLQYFDGYSTFQDTARLTFSAVGCDEAYLAKRAFSQNSTDSTKEIPYKRFYLAGAIHKIISGVPVWEVSRVFNIPRGTLQSAMSACSAHASKLSHFTKELSEYWALSAVFDTLVQKLFFAGTPELAPILELPGIRHARAKQLYKCGYQTLQKLAAAEPRLLASDIEHLTQTQAQKIISSAKIMLKEQADALTDAALQLLEDV